MTLVIKNIVSVVEEGANLWCNVSPSPTNVSPTENSWMLHPLDKISLGYCAPDRTITSLNSDFLIAF
jgi:hypothetical protein